jgi:hypothetical protein
MSRARGSRSTGGKGRGPGKPADKGRPRAEPAHAAPAAALEADAAGAAADPPGVAARDTPAGAAGDGRAARRRNPLMRALSWWVGVWDHREPPTALALVRILVATVLLGDLLQALLYGLVPTIWGPPPEGLGWGGVGMNGSAIGRWLGPSTETAWLLWGGTVVIALCVIFGVLTRVTCILLALAWAQLGWMSPDSDRGIDFMLRAVLMVLACSSCHARWSVDAWVRRKLRRPFPALVPAWPRYLLILQLVWIYFSAGHNKSDGAWGPLEGYSALANILTDPHFARFPATWIQWFYPLLQVATGLTMVFELGSPLMLPLTYWSATRDRPGFLRRWANKLRLRWVWIFLGVQFHIGIGVMMRLGIFPWGMLALYPVLFHPEELARAETWIRSRLSRFRARQIAPGSPAG